MFLLPIQYLCFDTEHTDTDDDIPDDLPDNIHDDDSESSFNDLELFMENSNSNHLKPSHDNIPDIPNSPDRIESDALESSISPMDATLQAVIPTNDPAIKYNHHHM